jgi:uncharacterized membrane protein YfcA
MMVLLPAYGILGGLSGFLAGLLGVGGGIVLVPGIVAILGLFGFAPSSVMHIAVGTSLAVIIPTGISSALAHWRRGAVRMDLVKRIAPGIVMGVMIGAVAASALSGAQLQIIFAGMLCVLAAVMGGATERFMIPPRALEKPWTFVAGGIIGAVSSVMGIGGATVSVPYMTLCRVPIHQAVGTASALGLAISIPAAIGFMMIHAEGAAQELPMTTGSVHWPAVAMIAPAAILAAPLGAKVAHRAAVGKLKAVFILFMIVVAMLLAMGAGRG